MTLPMTEAQMQSTIIDAAGRLGFLAHHSAKVLTPQGWRTPVQGDVGFPDLVLALDGHVLAWELKLSNGRLRREQALWADELRGENGAALLEYDVVRPATLAAALERLHDVSSARRRGHFT